MWAPRLVPSVLRSLGSVRPHPTSSRVSLVRPVVPQPFTRSSFRSFASKSTVDERIEDIQDQYATAKDEFEIATEETEKMSVYAQEDRNAAREELDKLKEMFNEAIADPETGEEVRGRIGQRVRELDHAVQALEELALNQD